MLVLHASAMCSHCSVQLLQEACLFLTRFPIHSVSPAPDFYSTQLPEASLTPPNPSPNNFIAKVLR